MAEQTFGRRIAATWAATVFVGIALATTAIVVWMHGERVRQLEVSTAVVAGQSQTHLSAWIDARWAIVETLAMRWSEVYAADPGVFRRDTERLLDLLVTDVVMPRMGGLELRDRLSRRVPDLRVLFVSGYTSLEPGAESLKLGDGLLPKPFRPGVLLDKVAERLARVHETTPHGALAV